MVIKHESAIDWPNGLGYTPCSIEYAAITDQINSLSDYGRISMDDMSPTDYQTYNTLLDKQVGLQMNGHVGKSQRF